MGNEGREVNNEHLVEMRNIHKWFGSVHALRGVNLEIDRSEVLGLVGDNGAGKSTLIKILSGFHPKDEGEIYFERNKVEINSTRYAQKLGIETVYQDRALAPKMGISRNIFMGREVTKNFGFMDKEYMDSASMDALINLGLDLRSPDALVETLSGGERQGVAIARTLRFKAKLVILDEPTIALSVKEVDQVLNFIRRLGEEGISVVFITHNLYHVFPVAERFVVLDRGVKVGEVRKEHTSIEELSELLTKTASREGQN